MAGTFDELSAHLQKVDQDPALPLDTDLLEKCGLVTSTPEYGNELWKQTQPLFLQMATLLPKLQQDPSPLTHFIIKLAGPYRFDDIKNLDFEIGLDLQATPFHHLILSLLEKATASSNDASALANRPSVVLSIVRLWLCTQDTGVAEEANALLLKLLRVSKNEPGAASSESGLLRYGKAPMWKRLFNDRDIYTLYYHYTSLSSISDSIQPSLSNRDKTIAQARLLDWLPLVGDMDWNTIVTSHVPEVERAVGLAADQGPLHYASLKMVDTEGDLLMYMTLINFFQSLIVVVQSSPHLTPYDSSLSLDFVKDQGIHNRIIDLYTSDSPGVEHSFLASRTSKYIAKYAWTYPENFEASPELQTVRNHVHENIRKCESNDLSIVECMPRPSLVPVRSTGLAWDECLVLDVPVTRTNADALKTLASVFHGPEEAELTFPVNDNTSSTSPGRRTLESTYARLLTSLFMTKYPTFLQTLVTHAETIAMKDTALAALNLLDALISSRWPASPQRPAQIPANDPIYTRLDQFPATGVDLILDPRLSGGVLPYLLRPATTFSNVVGGRGEAENAAYQVAMAKFGVLKTLGQKLAERPGVRDDVRGMVAARIAEGPWGLLGARGVGLGRWSCRWGLGCCNEIRVMRGNRGQREEIICFFYAIR